ncbi:hypothetical protein ACWFMI_01835 [Nocardiopsis terrae]
MVWEYLWASISGYVVALVMFLMAWVFYRKYDKIQDFLLSGLPRFFRVDEYRQGRIYSFNRKALSVLFVFFGSMSAFYATKGFMMFLE